MNEEKSDSKRSLESYLLDDFNVEIYNDVAGVNNIGSPKEFFDWLYKQFDYIAQNKGLSEDVREVIKKLAAHANTRTLPSRMRGYHTSLHIEPRYQLRAFHLARLIRHRYEEVDGTWKDEGVKQCSNLIEIELERSLHKAGNTKHSIREVRFVSRRRKYEIAQIKRQIEALLDDKARLEFLYKIKGDALQEQDFPYVNQVRFCDSIDIEIDKYKKLGALPLPTTESGSSIAQLKVIPMKDEISKIVWAKSNSELVCLIEILQSKGKIITDTPWKLVEEHFVHEDGTPFKPESLKVLFQSAAESTRESMRRIVQASESTAQSMDESRDTTQKTKKRLAK